LQEAAPEYRLLSNFISKYGDRMPPKEYLKSASKVREWRRMTKNQQKSMGLELKEVESQEDTKSRNNRRKSATRTGGSNKRPKKNSIGSTTPVGPLSINEESNEEGIKDNWKRYTGRVRTLDEVEGAADITCSQVVVAKPFEYVFHLGCIYLNQNERIKPLDGTAA
jgi:hypothetical protein